MKDEKMDKVATVAKIAEQKSARDLSASRQSYQQKRAQLDQLVKFKEEYELSLRRIGVGGIDARQLQDYRLFLGKLGQAIDQQYRDVEESRENLKTVRAQWLSKSQRKSALDHLVDERHKVQVKFREKAEQEESDENTLARRITAGNH